MKNNSRERQKFVMCLDPEYDGACPCSHFVFEGHDINTHCWRSSFNGCNCEFSGIHISGPKPDLIRFRLLSDIMAVWFNTDWEVVIEEKA